MPISGGNYVAPAWTDNGEPAINDTELSAISQTLEECQILKGSGAPSQYTDGKVAQYYVDTSTNPNTIYQCKVSASEANVWEMAGAVSVNLAQGYDAGSTYDAGAYCIWDGVLYRARQDIPEPEPWNPSHWRRAYLADDLESHVVDTNNPHGVTAAQAGLGNLDNVEQYSDSNPPVTAASVTLSAAWSGEQSPYHQTAAVLGAALTAGSKVDLQPTPAQIATLIAAGVTGMVSENNSGVLTVYALGAAPAAEIALQCTVEETTQASGSIFGNPMMFGGGA